MSETENVVNYFRVVPSSKNFERTYARVKSFKPHELKIYAEGQTFIITSDYDMTQMMVGPVIAGFVFKKKKDKYAKMYPLPTDMVFTEESLKLQFEPLSQEDRRKIVMTNPNVVESQKLDQLLQNQLLEALRQRSDLMETQKKLAEALPNSVRVAIAKPEEPTSPSTENSTNDPIKTANTFCLSGKKLTLDRKLRKAKKKAQSFLHPDSVSEPGLL